MLIILKKYMLPQFAYKLCLSIIFCIQLFYIISIFPIYYLSCVKLTKI